MALQQFSRQRNFNLTVKRLITQRFEGGFAGAYANRVFYDDSLADPTAMDARLAALRYFVGCRWLTAGVGMRLPTILQVDFYYYAGAFDDQSVADRDGDKLSGMVDDFISIWSPNDAAFKIYDFSSNPSAPMETAAWAIPRSANGVGRWGWPDERVRMPVNKGLWHEILTYSLWADADLHPSQCEYF